MIAPFSAEPLFTAPLELRLRGGHLYLHRSRTLGQARFIPMAVVMSKDIYNSLPADERANTGSPLRLLGSGGMKQMVPVWEAFSYLIVGCEPWDVDENFSNGNTHQVRHGVSHFCGHVGSIKNKKMTMALLFNQLFSTLGAGAVLRMAPRAALLSHLRVVLNLSSFWRAPAYCSSHWRLALGSSPLADAPRPRRNP
jgi:hypothetical protein